MPGPKTPMPSREEQLAIGRRVHEREWPSIGAASLALRMAEPRLYAMQRLYRDSIGFMSEFQINATKGALNRKRKPAKAKAAVKAAAKEAAAAPAVTAEIETPPAPPAPTAAELALAKIEAKKAGDRERSAQRRAMLKAERSGANGYSVPPAGRHVVPFEDQSALIEKLNARIADLEADNEFLRQQANIFNKLLITVGSTL